ncbi:fatty acid CoA ligase FadD22 [Amycolatopsis sulphurea]|uniref:Fatty acid CoA ligase FadD22 n=1 Tax=Amycolatopsis sulphurea TaxID=76022 RepID=A0A2A9FAW8_9PSEU|nr:class I adenylate-forming enzyme family protein [Amycolatopsis sulphurea]PFG47946.1 fatty acid CoA ligase FadD22 [Amycolatopsis sulphurea]
MPDNVTERLAEYARTDGWDDNIAFIADEQEWTFAQVYAGAARAAGGYRAAGLRPADRVLLALPDSIEMVWCMLGAWQAGLVAIPVNVHMSRADLERDVATAEPALAVTDPETAGWLDAAGVVRTCGAGTLTGAEPDPGFAPGDEAPALGMFTSGTTGNPKLCFFLHRDLGVRMEIYGLPGAGAVGFSASRMCFRGGLGSGLFASLIDGQATVLSRPRPTPAIAVELMRRHRVTALFSPPSFLARLLLEPGHEEVLDALRSATCVGEAMSARIREQLVPLLGERLINGYGSTEIGGIAVGRPADYHPSPSAVGPSLGGQPMRILDEEGNELPAGESGQLHVRVRMGTRGVARGSLGPDQVYDVWWATGDLATIDENAILHVHGRLDDVEVIGGQNVVPAEVERLLESHPRVLEGAVSAVRRPEGFTSLRAYLVAAPGEGSDLDALTSELLDLTRDRLSFYKVPDDVVWLDSLPRNGNGKILRRQLRAQGDQFV